MERRRLTVFFALALSACNEAKPDDRLNLPSSSYEKDGGRDAGDESSPRDANDDTRRDAEIDRSIDGATDGDAEGGPDEDGPAEGDASEGGVEDAWVEAGEGGDVSADAADASEADAPDVSFDGSEGSPDASLDVIVDTSSRDAEPDVRPPTGADNEVADITTTLTGDCRRLRSIPVRFLSFHEEGQKFPDWSEGQEVPDWSSAGRRAEALKELNETFSAACLSFYERAPDDNDYVIAGTKMSYGGGLLKKDGAGTPLDGAGHSCVQEPDPEHGGKAWLKDCRYEPNWDWSRDAAGIARVVPFNPRCKYQPPSGVETAEAAFSDIVKSCALADELVVAMSGGSDACRSEYPSRYVEMHPGCPYARTVAYHFGLADAESVARSRSGDAWRLPDERAASGEGYGGRSQVPADYWDLVYLRGDETSRDRFFKSRAKAANEPSALSAIVGPDFAAILRGGPGAPYPSTESCDGWRGWVATGPTALEQVGVADPRVDLDAARGAKGEAWDPTFNKLCEFRRMFRARRPDFEAFQRQLPHGALLAMGQSLTDWHRTSTFRPGFIEEFGYEVGGTAFNVASALAPPVTTPMTKSDPDRHGWQVMSGARPVAPSGSPEPFPALSRSQIEIVSGLVCKYDIAQHDPDAPEVDGPGNHYQANPHRYGQRPAYGSWESIGKNLEDGVAPVIAGTPHGVFIAARNQSGLPIVRQWRYGSKPWGTSTVDEWKTLPNRGSGPLGVAYRAETGSFDVVMRQPLEDGGVSFGHIEVQTNGSLREWTPLPVSMPFATEGAPAIVSIPPTDVVEASLMTMIKTTGDRLIFMEWRPDITVWWPEWLVYGYDPQPAVVQFSASSRRDGRFDVVVLGKNGNYLHASSDYVSTTSWESIGDLGCGPPNAEKSQPPSTLSFYDGTYVVFDVVATDCRGAVHMQTYAELFDRWWNWQDISDPSDSKLGRATISVNQNNDRDVVVRDLVNGTVRIKRLWWRNGGQEWMPSSTTWYDLGGEATSDPVAVPRPDYPDVVDVFVVSKGNLMHRAFVVPPHGSPGQPELDYNTYCCTHQHFPASSCPCEPFPN